MSSSTPRESLFELRWSARILHVSVCTAECAKNIYRSRRHRETVDNHLGEARCEKSEQVFPHCTLELLSPLESNEPAASPPVVEIA